MSKEWNTRKSLLKRVRDSSDEQAWADFLGYYENFIYHILRQMELNTEECNDLVQDILLKLWKNLKSYDPEKARFRTWLGRVVRNAAYDYFSKAKTQSKLLEEERAMAETICSTSASELETMIAKEWELYMTSYAMERMRGIFSGEALNVFSMSLDGVPTEVIAQRLNLNRDSVYTLRNRVKSRLIKEVHAIMKEVEG
ncbi:MAG: sigma-70 family RNA polymerase sigma factor [Pontiella sp.]|nr:sigma-70 family RNA polymerase sigma factor [Pontiella sp.]